MKHRTISLTVEVAGAEDYVRTFSRISEVAQEFVESHDYVSISSNVTDSEDFDRMAVTNG